jgi:hypothetical protein
MKTHMHFSACDWVANLRMGIPNVDVIPLPDNTSPTQMVLPQNSCNAVTPFAKVIRQILANTTELLRCAYISLLVTK